MKKICCFLLLIFVFSGFMSRHKDAVSGQPEKSSQGRTQKSETRPVPTNTWAIGIAHGADPGILAQKTQLEYIGPVGTLENYHLFLLPAEKARTFDAQTLRNLPEVQWMERQYERRRFKRLPPDPLFPAQWHLNNTGQSKGTPGMDANVVPVWQQGVFGNGVQVAIVDDGLQHSHPDLSDNYAAEDSWNFNDDSADPSPVYAGDRHGTSVAGVAAARDDGISCGVGAAYRAGLAGIRLIADPVTDAQEAAALTFHYDNNHIFNNSWGPSDDAQRLEGPGTLTQLALEDGIENGRGGLGSIYVWAGGNGNLNHDNVNYDGYANSRHTIAVGAVDHNGVQAYYSEPGAAMLITAPASGSGVGISTTDLLGDGGYSDGNCTDGFGGTSSSAPLVSGVVSLMLEARPDLTWRDVQHILVQSAVRNDSDDSGWSQNSAGRWVNHKYGFGMVDAQKAVELASSWVPEEPVVVYDSGVISAAQTIPDNDPDGVLLSFFVPQNLTLEHVEVVFSATHAYRGDLAITLVSPRDTQSVLATEHLDENPDYPEWKFMSVRHWGESCRGLWTLKVADMWAYDTGTWDSWRLIFYGRERQAGSSGFLPGALMLLGDE